MNPGTAHIAFPRRLRTNRVTADDVQRLLNPAGQILLAVPGAQTPAGRPAGSSEERSRHE